MPEKTQTLKNHARLLPPFHLFVMPVLFLNFLNALWHLWRDPAASTVWAAIVAAALGMLALLSRMQVITVQDRLIRLEMRLRLRDVLAPDLQGRIGELTHTQLIAMRFASDAELPELTREVLAGNLGSPKAIKMRVRDWQADWLRA
jgi:Family of unknown function (DUF6526)